MDFKEELDQGMLTKYFQELGKRSKQALLIKYGPDYFKRIRRGEKPSKDK